MLQLQAEHQTQPQVPGWAGRAQPLRWAGRSVQEEEEVHLLATPLYLSDVNINFV